MNRKILIAVIAGLVTLQVSGQSSLLQQKPVKVELRLVDSNYQLYRDGKLFF